MSSLFLVGNVNEQTFANAILAAHFRDREKGGLGLQDICVIHSPESEQHLSSHTEWKNHLKDNGLSFGIFCPCTVDLYTGNDEQLSLIARHVERFLCLLDPEEDIYVDLTNGSSLYKSVLSNIAFILGVQKQFILDTEGKRGFLSHDELRSAYTELPDPLGLDALAQAWLTEVRRFKIKVKETSQTFTKICGIDSAKKNGFKGDIENAINSWFHGERTLDGAALGGAVRYVGRAFEDLVRGVQNELFTGTLTQTKKSDDRLYQMLNQICSRLFETAPDYEPKLIEDVSQLLRRLRNDATHEQISFELGRIKARLSTELLFSTSDYFRILFDDGLIKPLSTTIKPERQKCKINGQSGLKYYFGLDGDDTGRELERLFQLDVNNESFRKFSNEIDNAMKKVSKKVKEAPLHGKIIFCSGDDLFFQGKYHVEALEELRYTFNLVSGGRTCCIGFGKTPREAYVALKMAKANPGKDCMIGVEFVEGN